MVRRWFWRLRGSLISSEIIFRMMWHISFLVRLSPTDTLLSASLCAQWCCWHTVGFSPMETSVWTFLRSFNCLPFVRSFRTTRCRSISRFVRNHQRTRIFNGGFLLKLRDLKMITEPMKAWSSSSFFRSLNQAAWCRGKSKRDGDLQTSQAIVSVQDALHVSIWVSLHSVIRSHCPPVPAGSPYRVRHTLSENLSGGPDSNW